MKKFINVTMVVLLFCGVASAQTQYQVVKLMVTGSHPNYKEDSLYDCHYDVLKYKEKIVIGRDVYVIDSSYKMEDDPKETEYFCHLGKTFAAILIIHPIEEGSLPGEKRWRANTEIEVIIDNRIFYYSANKIRKQSYAGK